MTAVIVQRNVAIVIVAVGVLAAGLAVGRYLDNEQAKNQPGRFKPLVKESNYDEPYGDKPSDAPQRDTVAPTLPTLPTAPAEQTYDCIANGRNPDGSSWYTSAQDLDAAGAASFRANAAMNGGHGACA